MTANLHRVRLYRKNVAIKVREADVFLDPADDARVREVLVELASAHAGRKLDLADWRIEIEQKKAPVHVVAKAQVDSSGRTEIKR